MGSHGSISTEVRLRADDLKHLIRPKYVKGLTRSAVQYARPMFGTEPLHGQEILVVVGRFRHHINGSGSLLSNSWDALTYDLAAVYGCMDETKPLHFYGVTTHLFDRFLNCPNNGNDASWHLFVLGPGELIRSVDICWHEKYQGMLGIRLHTNQRQSQWFGKRAGVIKSVTAPQGYFINAIDNLKPRTGKSELGLRLCPITDNHLTRGGGDFGMAAMQGSSSSSSSSSTLQKSVRVGEPLAADGVQTEFTERQDHVRAIVVKCSAEKGIEDLHVLSPELYNRHLAKREDALPPQEHIFFLRHGEHITQVEVRTSTTSKIGAVRFHTNLAKSPWYGEVDESNSMEVTQFQVPDKSMQICGFHGSFGEDFLGALGVVYGPISSPVAVESHSRLLQATAAQNSKQLIG